MSQVIALDSIKKVGEQVAAPAGGCEAKSCGSEQGPDDLAPEIWEKVKDHPCYSEQAHHYFARMHVAVAPACNIQCNYCNRKYDCANESRPGVVSQKLTPDQALRKVLAVATEIPQMSVVGVAGPGDALANPHKTFPFFQELKEKAPDIRQCLSTNGLALPDYVDEIAELGVDHVTITMNAIDPEVGAKIYPWIFYDHKRWHGVEAAKILLERQLQGLEMLVARGILVKINSVMIPGINDRHLIEVNKAVKARGAFLHNIMPLISDPAHGTHFGLTGQRGPTAKELEALRDACEGGARMMRHCRQCRADAVGLLGEDRGAEFTLDKLPEEPEYDPAVRAAYRAHIEAEQAQRQVTRASGPAEGPVHKVAIATKGGERINQHFGHAKEFLVYEVSEKGVRFLSHRPVPQYCQGGHGDDDAFANVIEAIADVDAVLVAKIGGGPAKRLAEAGIAAVDTHAFDYIEESVLAWYAARTAEDGSAVA